MKNTAKEMLADWLRPVEIVPNTEVNNSREAVIKKLLKTKDNAFWLNLLRTAMGATGKMEDSDFVAHFKKSDESFPLTGNEHLIKILATITICYKLESGDSDLNHLISLAIVNSRLVNSPAFESQIPIIEYATENSEISSGTLRTVDLNQIHERIEELESQKEEDTDETTTRELVGDLYRLNIKLLEEVNILWWLYTGYSHFAKQPFSQIKTESLPIYAARELYDLMHISRLIESSPQFFIKVMGEKSATDSDVFTTVNSISESNRKQLIDGLEEGISEFTPIAKAIVISLGVSDGDDWSGAYRKQVGGDIKKKMKSHDIAEQFYRELMFLRLSKS